MASHYFHDPNEPAVYEVTPIVSPKYTKRHKPPRYDGSHVYGTVNVTKPTWWQVGDRWTNTAGTPMSNHYDQRDDEATSERWFVTVHCHLGGFTKITRAQYDALVAQYNAQAQANKPPGA